MTIPKAPFGVVRVGVCICVFVVDSMVKAPFMNWPLNNFKISNEKMCYETRHGQLECQKLPGKQLSENTSE